MDANHHSRPLRLLVIIDNLDIAENIGDYFQARGGILDFAMDGIGGLHLALTHPYDVIILDIMLPGMDGLTLCRKLRKEAVKAPPVLMLTARDTLNDKLEGFASGADDYLVKPFALQDSLSNFANGLMILFFRPFDVGHFVEAGGVSGKVESLNLVSTTIKTLDNRLMVVPNKKVWQDVITNSSAFDERRVDMEFGTGYNDDIDKAQAILEEVVAAHPKVLEKPAPKICVNSLGESSVNFIVRPWAKWVHRLGVFWDITREVKKRFDAEGIGIP